MYDESACILYVMNAVRKKYTDTDVKFQYLYAHTQHSHTQHTWMDRCELDVARQHNEHSMDVECVSIDSLCAVYACVYVASYVMKLKKRAG